MTYFAPFIDASGLNIPTYQDIEDLLVANAKSIFGSDIYLDNDSQDFQEIAARAQAIYDTMLTAQLSYNNRSPLTAVGDGLDTIVALNGLAREAATNSLATLTLTGTAYTLITNGVAVDVNGNAWNLPPTITLNGSGTATVTATCQVAGPVTALAGQIINIATPTSGWTGVTNAQAATPGRNVETDSELRARQAYSVANPSQALTTGILGGVLAVTGVVGAQLYENDTSSPVSTINGVPNPGNYPANSITLVVNGGVDTDIASAIATRKTPGCYTNGDQSDTVLDRFGVATTIRFYRPTTKTIDVAITIKALNGYNSTIGTQAQQAIVNYINSLVAGQNVVLSQLEYAAASVNTNPASPYFSITSLTAAIDPASPGSTDITMNFNWQAITAIGNIALTVT